MATSQVKVLRDHVTCLDVLSYPRVNVNSTKNKQRRQIFTTFLGEMIFPPIPSEESVKAMNMEGREKELCSTKKRDNNLGKWEMVKQQRGPWY